MNKQEMNTQPYRRKLDVDLVVKGLSDLGNVLKILRCSESVVHYRVFP